MSRTTALERARLRVQGEHGVLDLRDGRVTIVKDAPTRSRVNVSVDRIRSTSRPPSRSGRGRWLHVNVVGGSPTPMSDLVAITDPHTVRVTSRSAGAAKRFERLVHEHLLARGLPSEPDPGLAGPENGRYSSAVAVTDAATTRPDTPEHHYSDESADERGVPVNGQAVARLRDERRPRQLAQLSELHAAGALTDEEFNRARARLLH